MFWLMAFIMMEDHRHGRDLDEQIEEESTHESDE